MTINFKAPDIKELKPRILVMGVGGAGGNAINGMIEHGLQGVEFIAVNTDAQDLKMSNAKTKIQMGLNLTKGLGAGARLDIGQAAADESLNEIINIVQGSNMVFITAGMGGGTGTGAAHVIARAAKELNILTVGVITLPFLYEGPSRMRRAQQGLEELRKHVDTIIVVPNQNLFKIASEQTTFEESFELSNDVLLHGVKSITDLMVRPGLINLDFADVETVMSSMGKAMMGTGEAEGEGRATKAAEAAINNPLIDDYTLKGAKGLLVNITGGKDLKLFEVDEAVNKVRAEVDTEAELIIGAITDPALEGKMRVSIVATALDNEGPQTKPVISMVHRIHGRNAGYKEKENLMSNLGISQPTLGSTQGATALDMNVAVEEKSIVENNVEIQENTTTKSIEENKDDKELLLENISIENATYLQNQEQDKEVPNFEVESIELATPELFVDQKNTDDMNQDQSSDMQVFEDYKNENNSETITEAKDPEMFENLDDEKDFEIPAFLRRQKN